MKSLGTVLTGLVLLLLVTCQTPDKSKEMVPGTVEDTALFTREDWKKV